MPRSRQWASVAPWLIAAAAAMVSVMGLTRDVGPLFGADLRLLIAPATAFAFVGVGLWLVLRGLARLAVQLVFVFFVLGSLAGLLGLQNALPLAWLGAWLALAIVTGIGAFDFEGLTRLLLVAFATSLVGVAYVMVDVIFWTYTSITVVLVIWFGIAGLAMMAIGFIETDRNHEVVE